MQFIFASALLAFPSTSPLPLCPTLRPIQEAAKEDPTLEERLERLAKRLEEARIEYDLPGLAVAVVKDDEMVFAQGFGLANVDKELPVTPETLFAIGSTTKAFTSNVLGMLQDDGLLDYDDPITQHLPFFKLPIDVEGEDEGLEVTLRDLLSHRTGFTRMSMLWAGGGASRQQVLEAAVKAEPWGGFREQFYYNNVMYMAAGVAGGTAAGSDWETLVRERLFKPLGMNSSNLSITDAQTDERLALGYEWNEGTGSFDHKEMLNLDTIGPAGSINSNILDMARWVRFQLGEGKFEGERLLSKKTIKDTWRANLQIGGGVGYGLGWMLRRHNKYKVVEHGGNINGFSAQVSLIPKEDLGYVLLTNVSGTPLQQISIQLVFDTLLGEIASEGEGVVEQPKIDFDEFVGNYRANFGSFKNVDFEVQVKNGNLAIDVPGQMVYELKIPDEEGKWYFKITDTVAISFERDEAGKVVGLWMHQGGLNFEMPREGVVLKAEIPLTELQPFLGTYFHEESEMEVQVLIQNQRLAVDVPDQMVYELNVPDQEGKRTFRVKGDLAVRFDENEMGQIHAVTFIEPGGTRQLERTADAPDTAPEPLPSLEEFFDLYQQGGRALLLQEHRTLKETGSVRLAQCGIEGTYTLTATLEPRAYRMSMDFGVFGQSEFGSDGTRAWAFSSAQGYEPTSGVALDAVLQRHPVVLQGDWRQSFDSVEVLRHAEEEGRRLILVEIQQGETAPMVMHVDRATGRVLRTDHTFDNGQIQFPMSTAIDDFREVHGVTLAHVATEENEMSGRTITSAAKVEVGIELPEDFHVYKGEK